MYRLLPSFLLVWSYNYDDMPCINATRQTERWNYLLYILLRCGAKMQMETAAKVLCACVCTAVLSWISQVRLDPLSLTKRLPVYLILNPGHKRSRECHNYKPQPFPDTRGRGNRKTKKTTTKKKTKNKQTKKKKPKQAQTKQTYEKH